MERTLSTKEASEKLGLSVSEIRKRCASGELRAIRKKEGKRLVWAVIADQTSHQAVDYAQVYEDWVSWQKGNLAKGKPMSPKSIQANEYGLSKFWEKSGVAKNINNLNTENLKTALNAYKPDTIESKCYYSQRFMIYKAYRSITRYMMTIGLREPRHIDETTQWKPRRLYEAKRKILRGDAVARLLDANNDRYSRTDRDVALADVLLKLALYGGLRVSELLNLQIENIHLNQGVIEVLNGKGNKDRSAIVLPELKASIENWLKYRGDSTAQNLLTTKTGAPLNNRNALRVVHYLARKAGVSIDLHGLRRTCSLELSKRGMPAELIQKMLGHAQIETTMNSYLLVTEHELLDWLKTTRQEATEPKKAPPRRPRFY